MLRRRPLPRRPPISPRTRGHFRAGSTTPPCSGMPPFTTMGREVLDAIVLNLNLAVVGCTVAIRRFLQDGKGGAIVNVSSHQAQRAVRGALPYATAKAAIEGLTRAGSRLRTARRPDQRRGTRFDHYGALRGV